jgi:hypothetical protein
MSVKIWTSLSGTFFFENELLSNPVAFSNYIEVHLHHILECDTLRNAVDLYLKLIYDDIKEQSSRKSGNLFTKLVIEQTEDPQHLIKMEFTIKEIIERRTVFYHLLEEAVVKKSKIYSKVF